MNSNHSLLKSSAAPPNKSQVGVVEAGSEANALAKSKIKRDGLNLGELAPTFSLPGLYGGTYSLGDWAGKDILLVFIDPDCQPCTELSRFLQRQHSSGVSVSIVAISRGDHQSNLSKARDLAISFPILLQNKWEISKEYAIFATPVAYFIDQAGLIAADVAIGVEPIQALFQRVRGGIVSRIQSRLEELNREYTRGEEELQALDQKRNHLVETMHRILGARQVLSELMNNS